MKPLTNDPTETRAADYFTTLVTRFEKTKRYDALSGGLLLLPVVIGFGIPGILAAFLFGDIGGFGPNLDSRNASDVIPVVPALVVLGGVLFAGVVALDGHLRKASLRGPMLAFCYAFDCLWELTAYATNGLPEHADLANKALEGFLKHSEVNFKLSVEEMHPVEYGGAVKVTVQKDVNIGEILGSLTDSVSWLELAPQSAAIAKAIRMNPERLQRRLAMRVDVDAVLECVRDLMLHQYTVISTTIGSQSVDADLRDPLIL